jgi:hypothetical protein
VPNFTSTGVMAVREEEVVVGGVCAGEVTGEEKGLTGGAHLSEGERVRERAGRGAIDEWGQVVVREGACGAGAWERVGRGGPRAGARERGAWAGIGPAERG